MTVVAKIFELDSEDNKEPRGQFEFLELPSKGDLIPLLGPGGMSWEHFRVLFVEHNPVVLPRDEFTEDMQPWVAIYVEFVSREAT